MVTKERNHLNIMVDKETHGRFKELAGNDTIAGYLRKLSIQLAEGTYISPVMEKLEIIERKIDKIPGYWREDKSGRVVEVNNYGFDIPAAIAAMIDEAIEEDPNVKQVGFYDRTDSGEWVFNKDRYLEYNNPEKDKEVEEMAREFWSKNRRLD